MKVEDMGVSLDQLAHDLGTLTDLAKELVHKADGSPETEDQTMAILTAMKVSSRALADILESQARASFIAEHGIAAA